MAKADRKLNHNTSSDDVTVKSRTYPVHVRKKRGTHKKATLNIAFKTSSKNLLTANIPAKIFSDAIAPYRGRLAGGQFWQRLLSLFRKQIADHGAIDFALMPRIEISETHRLEKLISVDSTARLIKSKSVLSVDVRCNDHPSFGRIKSVDGYVLTVITIFPDQKKKTAKVFAVSSDIIKVSEGPRLLQPQFQVPAKAESFVVCLKIEGYIGGRPSEMLGTIGMCVANAGSV